jgi:hypothetical protein
MVQVIGYSVVAYLLLSYWLTCLQLKASYTSSLRPHTLAVVVDLLLSYWLTCLQLKASYASSLRPHTLSTFVYLLLSYLLTCFFLTCLLAQVIGYEVLARRGLIHKFKLEEDKLRLWYSV